MNFHPRGLLCAASLLALAACKLPEQRQNFYANGTLKERFWIYQVDGREVLHGMYVSYFPNGQREVEILYRDGSEVVKTYYSERGAMLGTLDVATLPDR